MHIKTNGEVLDGRILVVDDDPVIVMLIEGALANAGYKSVVSVTDPREAVALFSQERPDLVLLDLNMPYLSGFEVLSLLHKSEPELFIPIVVLSSQNDMEARIKALDLGAIDFIIKPFQKMELLTRIRNMLTVRMLQKKVENQNIILEQKVIKRTEELHDTRLEIIRRLGKAAEYRDDDTGAHIDRMAQMCVVVGREMGLDDVQLDLLLNAAPMHDIGKIGISDNILLKPGKLTPEERTIMETHSQIGATLLDGHDSSLMIMGRDVALTHHEKWDGTGYPNGLKGEEIPLVGRICAVCDVFDALTSVRPYKKAWSVDDSIVEIKRGSGSHFDPKAVDAFLAVLPDIFEIRKRIG